MKLLVNKRENIPCMAWCAVINKDEQIVNLTAGEKVEFTENSFVEGVWNGTFDMMNFDEASFFCGTGGILNSDGLLLSTPNHGLDKILTLKIGDTMYASNSLPFILQMSGSKLDPQYIWYEKDLCSIKNGLKEYKSEIPLKDNRKVQLYYFCNILITFDLDIHKISKKEFEPAKNYNEYHDGMLDALTKIKENAQAENRKSKFGIVTTVSKGYDSAACAAMAKKIGCTTALTFNRPEKYATDDGSEVARQLGYKDIRTANADHYKESENMTECFHVATGELGTTIVFEAFENEFKNNLVFYGERGDLFWGKNVDEPNREMRFSGRFTTGIGMTEWRLYGGFVILPIAFYNATNWIETKAISNSDEMKAWSTGTHYDRPIPRRMAEEMGVAREEFGQDKKGAGFNFSRDNLSRIKRRMSPVAFDSFYKFYKANKRKGTLLHQLRYIMDMLPNYYNYASHILHINRYVKEKIDLTSPGAPSYLFNWGIEEVMKYYK